MEQGKTTANWKANRVQQFDRQLVAEYVPKSAFSKIEKVGKFTCKYDIQIKNDKRFLVARKIIGPKGCQMKEIVTKVQSDGTEETVKLRLRGRGSGFKEGPRNKESDEELHLCVSANSEIKFKQACNLVEALLEQVYEEYSVFTQENYEMPTTLRIKKSETFRPRKWSMFSN